MKPLTPRPRLLCAALALALSPLLATLPATAADGAAPGHITPAHWPQPEWPFAADKALEQRIDALLASMTLEEKVGQIIQGDIASITPEDVRRYRLGSILAGGASDPGGRYNAAPSEWLALADAFWEASMDTRGGGKAIPIIWGIDAMHGQSNVVGATLFPHNVGLGATRNPELLREIARITAAETRTTGMEWTFAPTVAVPQDDRWGRAYEGYSEDPALVASFAGVFVEGLQGKVGDADFLDDHHVMTTVKHFLGDGGTRDGKDQGETDISEAELRDVHGAGYVPAIAAGAQSVMASFNSFHGEKMHGHQPLLTGVLKEQMNFGGFVVGDWNGHGQIKGCSNTDCARTFVAGLDMAMAPDSWKGMYESTLRHAKDGTLPMARLDDAVRRILRAKLRMGLFEKPRPSERALGGRFELLGAAEHRAVARRAVRESLVLLKNQGNVLPLAPSQRVLVAGDGADNMGKQAGGWTLSWQGDGTRREDFPNADTIWDGLKAQVEAAGGKAELAVDGRYTTRPDVAVVVFGEEPYAEFQGDLPNLLFKNGRTDDLDLMRRLKAEGIAVVAVFLTGRPLWVNREINAADAFVVAWLPGSEGGGVADVLLRDAKGAVQHDFHGTLSFSWPRRADQYLNNVGQKHYDPQYAFGYGLTYASPETSAPLSEDPGIDLSTLRRAAWFDRGKATTGNMLRMGGADGQLTDIVHPNATTRDGALAMTAINTDVQEGARQFVFNDSGAIELASNMPLDLRAETGDGMLVVASVRIESLPVDGKVSYVARCGTGCTGEVALGGALAALPKNQWTRIGVPLACLRDAGVDVANLTTAFGLHGGKGLRMSLAHVGIGAEFEHKVECR